MWCAEWADRSAISTPGIQYSTSRGSGGDPRPVQDCLREPKWYSENRNRNSTGECRLTLNPITAFVTVSLLFGTLIILATPPLRGPDETAHFLRAYGVAQGDIIPSVRDAESRMGVLIPPRLYEGFDFFESARIKEKEAGFTYGPVFQAYFSRRPARVDSDRPPTFVAYAGSEGYSPVAYLPQVAAALAARALDLDFVPTFYLMRFAGLAALTGLIAYAIAMVPNLAWAFLAISMLPAAIYGRSVINADGSALASAMVVTALWLRGILSPRLHMLGRQSFWLMLCALTKAPNLVFVLLGLMPLRGMPARRWLLPALTILPATAVAVIWTFSSGADTATWRMVEITGQKLDAFNPAVKLAYLLDHPLHFPTALISALHEKDPGEFWRQVIGVLGLFDTVLQRWVYPTVSVLFLCTFLARPPLATAARYQVATVATITVLVYIVVIYFVCYLAFTPFDESTVWGVQGRYFVPILPLVAIMVATVVNRAPNEWLSAALAISAAVLSGCACIEAILRTDWI
jgi:uncharacterized membrane protein